MFKRYLVLFLCLGLTGCASIQSLQLYQKYLSIYGNGINTDEVVTVVKKENYGELKQQIADAINASGYTAVIFEKPKEGFIVIAKEDNVHPSEIILKYTASAGEYKTRIELVKGSNDSMTNSQVSDDIQKIAEQIEND